MPRECYAGLTLARSFEKKEQNDHTRVWQGAERIKWKEYHFLCDSSNLLQNQEHSNPSESRTGHNYVSVCVCACASTYASERENVIAC